MPGGDPGPTAAREHALRERIVSDSRSRVTSIVGWLVPIAAVLAALVVGAIMLLTLDADPIDGYRAMVSGAFSGQRCYGYLRGTALAERHLEQSHTMREYTGEKAVLDREANRRASSMLEEEETRVRRVRVVCVG